MRSERVGDSTRIVEDQAYVKVWDERNKGFGAVVMREKGTHVRSCVLCASGLPGVALEVWKGCTSTAWASATDIRRISYPARWYSCAGAATFNCER